jgi:flagellar biosynthesis/type III secretory pathway protein FliH
VASLPDRIKADLTPVLAVTAAELVGKVAEGIVVPKAPTIEDLLPEVGKMVDSAVKALPASPTKDDLLPDLLSTLGNELHAQVNEEAKGIFDKTQADVAAVVKAADEAVAKAVADVGRATTEVVAKAEAVFQGLPAAAAEAVNALREDIDAQVVKAVAEAETKVVAKAESLAAQVLDVLPRQVDDEVARAMKALPVPEAAAPIDPAPMVEAALQDRLPAYEKALHAVIMEALGKAPIPKDFVVDRAGHLVGILGDGSKLDLGNVVGKDGDSVKPEDVLALVKEAVAGVPKPADGKDGVQIDGIDGELRDTGYFIVLRRPDGTVAKELRFPGVIYRGVYDEKRGGYYHGDQVTFNGSQWTAMAEKVDGTPGHDRAWVLSAKKGADQKTIVVEHRDPKRPIKVDPPKGDA